MRHSLRSICTACVLTAAPLMLSAPASANPPTCTNVGAGGSATLCQSPGNAQLNASPPDTGPVYPYPWDDEYWGPALVIGGNNPGGGFNPGGGGGGFHPGGGGHH